MVARKDSMKIQNEDRKCHACWLQSLETYWEGVFSYAKDQNDSDTCGEAFDALFDISEQLKICRHTCK